MRIDPLLVTKHLETLTPNNMRVITRFHLPGGKERGLKIVKRVISLSEQKVEIILKNTLDDFSHRHKDINKIFSKNFDTAIKFIDSIDISDFSESRKLLTGAYFTLEYSIESAAIFNPSIIAHPDQGNLKKGSIRVIISYRAVGEGHISSIEFRSAVINKKNDIIFDPRSKYLDTPELIENPSYDKFCFKMKLEETGIDNSILQNILTSLNEQFTYNELNNSINEVRSSGRFHDLLQERAFDTTKMLAKSNYHIHFHQNHSIDERVIFPITESESKGIEDARFVRFTNEDGKVTYYATYTAYDGVSILPQIIETTDFLDFKAITLNGNAAKNKGMALFPRKVDGKYVMVTRNDGENLFLSFSDDIHFWHKSYELQEPECSWEFIQIGNCGSPIETEAGWLLLTHGVGPVRRYCIGITLLDLKNPLRVIGKLKEPILYPSETEREGYVPNVVYTCGALKHHDSLIIPYAAADVSSKIAIISIPELLERLTS